MQQWIFVIYTGGSVRRVLFDGVELGDTGTTLVCSQGVHVVSLKGGPTDPLQQQVSLSSTSAEFPQEITFSPAAGS
jgi:hypothetical protein